jgi:uncharacterized RDD family membrane protein YckC
MSTCQICQGENAEGAKYCVRCGSQLPESAGAAPSSVFPEEPPAESVDRAEDLNFQAIQAVARDEVPEALELLSRALAADPTHVPSIRTRADILRRIGLTTQAAAEEAKIAGIETGGRVMAGFWARLLARFLDGIFSLLLSIIPGAIVGVIVYYSVIPENPTQSEEDDALTIVGYAFYAVAAAVEFLYRWVLDGRGGTWGKRALGLRVVNIQTGEPIGLGSSFLRLLVSWVGAGVVYLGWFWMLWDKKKQTWHDKVARSVVVKARP